MIRQVRRIWTFLVMATKPGGRWGDQWILANAAVAESSFKRIGSEPLPRWSVCSPAGPDLNFTMSMKTSTYIFGLCLVFAPHQSDARNDRRPPAWCVAAASKFSFRVVFSFRYSNAYGEELRVTMARDSSPPASFAFRIAGRNFESEFVDSKYRGHKLFGSRGVLASSASGFDRVPDSERLPMKYPMFGEDIVLRDELNGYSIMQVGYWRAFNADFHDVVKREGPRKGLKRIARDRSEDKIMAESLFRHLMATSTGEMDLESASNVTLDGLAYSSFRYSEIPATYNEAMPNRPTTRWIKLSDWARNHDVTVTYGDMTAEYVYRGERYLLPLASDQFKKGTAWFKTSGPILMRGDDWLIPTAMVD